MNMYDVIYKKREGEHLSKEEIDYFIKGYTHGEIPDYQASALLMAIYFQKVTKEEAYFFTQAMKCSGQVMDLSKIQGIKVDKHSTGGVGDKTTLIASPLAAACGVPIAKMSGRGLGFTGGTVDKMEAIPGFRTALDPDDFAKIVNEVGLCIIGQSSQIAAADKKLYALRDVTATVENMGMITASIMSKKLAAGSDAIVLDVKCGKGAFMETLEDAIELGEWMVDIGKSAGKKMAAFITEMGAPLGYAVGNSLEIIEVIETLKGNGPWDITELSLKLAAYMVYLGGKAASPDSAYEMVSEKLKSKEGLAKLRELIEAQGGDARVIEDDALLPCGKYQEPIYAKQTGYIKEINAKDIGRASQLCGAGREKKEDAIDLGAGIVLCKKVGDGVTQGELLGTIFSNNQSKMQDAKEQMELAFAFSQDMVEKPALIKKILT